jgi:methylase of polypeptide subunit release factors
MANSTLRNLKDSAFVRTDPLLSTRIGRTLLHLPPDPFSVWDPTCGTGSLFYACAHAPSARLFGTEISAERAQEAQSCWPHATILTTAFEAVSMQGMVDLLLVNPPYLFQDGKRASLRIIADA